MSKYFSCSFFITIYHAAARLKGNAVEVFHKINKPTVEERELVGLIFACRGALTLNSAPL